MRPDREDLIKQMWAAIKKMPDIRKSKPVFYQPKDGKTKIKIKGILVKK